MWTGIEPLDIQQANGEDNAIQSTEANKKK